MGLGLDSRMIYYLEELTSTRALCRKSRQSSGVQHLVVASVSTTPRQEYSSSNSGNIGNIKSGCQIGHVIIPACPRADYSDLSGVRQLMKTPGGPLPKSPMNDLTNIAGERGGDLGVLGKIISIV